MCLLCDLHDLFLIKIKVRRFPVVDQHRPLRMLVRTAADMLPNQVMILMGQTGKAL